MIKLPQRRIEMSCWEGQGTASGVPEDPDALGLRDLAREKQAAVAAGHMTAEQATGITEEVKAARELAQNIIARLNPQHVGSFPTLIAILESALENARTKKCGPEISTKPQELRVEQAAEAKAAQELAKEIVARLEPRHISGFSMLVTLLETAVRDARAEQWITEMHVEPQGSRAES